MATFRPHPFDMITKEEIENCKYVINENNPPFYASKDQDGKTVQWNYNSMTNIEPPKKNILPILRNGGDLSQFPRKSLVVAEKKGTSEAYMIIVNHSTNQMEKVAGSAGRKASLTADDVSAAERIGKADPVVRRRLKEEYQVETQEDLDRVTGDVWTLGYNGEGPDDAPFNNLRVVHLYFYFRRKCDLDNTYAHPVAFVVLIDLTNQKVVQLRDIPIQKGIDPNPLKPDVKTNFQVPNKMDNYLPELLNPEYYRKDIKPYVVTQPEGPSFQVKNKYEISWQKWNFRISFNYRTGLVFHYITYNAWDKQAGKDGDEERGKDAKFTGKMVKREVMYQAGLSEMVVPYGDPRSPYHRKSAFDMGEYGMGLNTNSLQFGCDCIGEVCYFDFYYSDLEGNAKCIKKAVCLHEEDAGTYTVVFQVDYLIPKQKHTEFRTGKTYLVRSRRLVVSFIATVTNYEYLFYWYFYQDGTIAHEIKASGELSTNLIAGNKTQSPWGTIVFPLINAQYHQHIFSMRLDFLVDGEKNTAAMYDVVRTEGALGSKGNPYANGFQVQKTVFSTAKQAITDTNTNKTRFWAICNESKVNEYSMSPVAWKLMPSTGAFAGLLAGDTSYIRKRAGFATHSFWVTPYKDDELYASGFYINQSKGNEGLEVWANRDENIKNTDIVVWHTFGLTHIPRVEDFPTMPVEGCGFMLKPYNFFYQNPALDVPPEDCYKLDSCSGKQSLRDASKDEICPDCWWGERRTVSTITCKHKELFMNQKDE